MSRILIVEDDKIVARAYRDRLSTDGHQVEVAADAETGLALAQRFQPEAVLLDLILPQMSGVEFIRKIRAQPAFQRLPIIVFSNTYLTTMVQDAWKAGATKCLSKACTSPKQLVTILYRVLDGDAAPAAPAQPHAAAAADRDSASEAELRTTLVRELPAILTSLRGALQTTIKSQSETARAELLCDMFRRVRPLAGNAGLAGLPHMAQLSSALEALLKELVDKPETITASSLRTAASAIDALPALCQPGAPATGQPARSPLVLVVDDDPISRRAVVYSLSKASLKSVSVDGAEAAFNHLLIRPFDLIVLDIDMPGTNGFELCSRLRELSAHKHTPVIFVTSFTDLESRANSTISGGNDFIAKPFLFTELAVKALVYVFRARAVPAK